VFPRSSSCLLSSAIRFLTAFWFSKALEKQIAGTAKAHRAATRESSSSSRASKRPRRGTRSKAETPNCHGREDAALPAAIHRLFGSGLHLPIIIAPRCLIQRARITHQIAPALQGSGGGTGFHSGRYFPISGRVRTGGILVALNSMPFTGSAKRGTRFRRWITEALKLVYCGYCKKGATVGSLRAWGK
jgi:hypothetical protein